MPGVKEPSIMKLTTRSSALLLAGLLPLAALVATAAGSKDAKKNAGAKTDYPLTTCVVSGDKLGGDMGGPVDYVYKEKGKPDRLVRFCCKDCIADFEKEPAKYLKKLDDAAAAKARESSTHNH
jgi:hypothetical protein